MGCLTSSLIPSGSLGASPTNNTCQSEDFLFKFSREISKSMATGIQIRIHPEMLPHTSYYTFFQDVLRRIISEFLVPTIKPSEIPEKIFSKDFH